MDQHLLSALRQSLMFDSLDESEIALVMGASRPVHYQGGQVLFREGDPGDSLIILTRGWVELCRTSPGGQLIQIGKAGPGEVLGEMALLDPAPRSATATVLAPAVAWFVSTERFEALLSALEPAAIKLLQQLSQVLCARLRSVVARIEVEITGTMGESFRAGGGRTRTARDFSPSPVARKVMAGRRSGPQIYASELVTTGNLRQPFPEEGHASRKRTGGRGAAFTAAATLPGMAPIHPPLPGAVEKGGRRGAAGRSEEASSAGSRSGEASSAGIRSGEASLAGSRSGTASPAGSRLESAAAVGAREAAAASGPREASAGSRRSDAASAGSPSDVPAIGAAGEEPRTGARPEAVPSSRPIQSQGRAGEGGAAQGVPAPTFELSRRNGLWKVLWGLKG